MINDDAFITIIITFLISFISLFLLLITIIIGIITYLKTKNIKIIPVYFLISAILTFGASLFIPWINLNRAYNSKQPLKNYQTAIKTSLIPSVRGYMYTELASYYASQNKGGTLAIENFEKGYKLTKSYKNMYMLGILYTAKGDYNKSMVVYKEQNNLSGIATNYILMNDYQNALKFINSDIKKNPDKSWSYRKRAIIYKYLKSDDLSQKDLQKALSICPSKKEELTYDIQNYQTSIKQEIDKIKKKNF